MELPTYNSACEKSVELSESSKFRYLRSHKRLLGASIATLVPIVTPIIHFGALSHLWDQYNYDVDTKRCSCSCWDTIFKGPYERGPAGYKHIYFNVTSNALKIWAVTVVAVLLLYEAVKTLLKLLFSKQIRVSMLTLLVLSIYPHYYSWWSYFNYWNDNFYDQWNHQLFFSLTELASTVMVVHLLDKRVPVSSAKCLVITSIAALHILSAGFDQFVDNVIRGNGMMHQVLRDIFFMVPDLCHVLLPLLELRVLARQRRLPSTAHAVTTQQFVAAVGFVASMWLLCRII